VTRYAIDALTAIRLVREQVTVHDEHQLVAPKSLQSQALSHLYREVRKGSLTSEQARTILDGITTMRIRLLGDRVSRGVAWKVAEQLDWDDTTNAEYVAVAKLQADYFVTLDEQLASQVKAIVATAPFEALLSTE
jgi:predicted nucleic acid-binding protein